MWKLQADLLEGRFMKEPENVQNIPKVNENIEIVDIADEKSPGKLECETKFQETLKAKENIFTCFIIFTSFFNTAKQLNCTNQDLSNPAVNNLFYSCLK